MEAQELKIGNMLRNKQTGATGHVSRPVGNAEVYSWIDQYEPIPVTPEWFERMGFDKKVVDEGTPDEVVYYSLPISNERYCDLALMSGDENGYLEVCLFPYEDFFRYRYVHQVQNLYFSIMGQELTISDDAN